MIGIVAAILTGLLIQNGLKLVDMVLVALFISILTTVWRLLLTQQTGGFDTYDELCELLDNGVKPSVVEFYSEHCALCSTMKPVVDRLEREAGRRLQVLRINIDKEPGKTLMDQYDVLFTPTFVHFDRNGRVVSQTVGLLHRARILYELKHAA